MLLAVHTRYRSSVQLLFAGWTIFHAFVVINFIKEKPFMDTIRVSNGLGLDQVRHSVYKGDQ